MRGFMGTSHEHPRALLSAEVLESIPHGDQETSVLTYILGKGTQGTFPNV